MSDLNILSLFSGAGGLDYGFEAAGFETRVALDLDDDACAALRANRSWPVIQGDVAAISSSEILSAANLPVGGAALLIGGPPCQPFSKSGYWADGDAKRLGDPRANTISAYLRVLEDTLPQAFLLENVPGLAFRGKSDGLDLIKNRVAELNMRCGTNYSISTACLNSADFGVPQTRHRVFVVGHRDGQEFQFPAATHGEAGAGKLEPYRTAWDALGDLPEPNDISSLRLSGKWAELIGSIPEGENYLWHTERGGGVPLFGWRTRYWNFLLKLSKSLPSWTLQSQPGPATGPFHWNNRKLSNRELLRIQTFPDDVQLTTSRNVGQKLVGNAVPSALAEVLGRSLAAQFFHLPVARSPLTLIPPARANVPAPEPLARVPEKYLALVGEHAAHPGTGKGRRAMMRLNGQLGGV